MKFILASASPRRAELIEKIRKDFIIEPSDFDESIITYKGDVEEYVIELAFNKALEISKKHSDALIIGCDTIVYLDDVILGKPKDENQAFTMLKSLSNKEHYVYSGVSIINTNTKEIRKFVEKTKVKFSKLTNEEILSYIESGEPLDKAGAYGIQGIGGLFVEHIEGCYYNIVGLPINKLYNTLKSMGVN